MLRKQQSSSPTPITLSASTSSTTSTTSSRAPPPHPSQPRPSPQQQRDQCTMHIQLIAEFGFATCMHCCSLQQEIIVVSYLAPFYTYNNPCQVSKSKRARAVLHFNRGGFLPRGRRSPCHQHTHHNHILSPSPEDKEVGIEKAKACVVAILSQLNRLLITMTSIHNILNFRIFVSLLGIMKPYSLRKQRKH